jgi:hypothetical protein
MSRASHSSAERAAQAVLNLPKGLTRAERLEQATAIIEAEIDRTNVTDAVVAALELAAGSAPVACTHMRLPRPSGQRSSVPRR